MTVRVRGRPLHRDSGGSSDEGARDGVLGGVGSGQFRALARRSAHLRALVTHLAEGWQRQADVVNVGLGGACIVVDELLSVDDAVSLSFTAPTLWDPLVLRGRIAWIGPAQPREPTRAGVAFEHKSPTGALALFDLVNTISYE